MGKPTYTLGKWNPAGGDFTGKNTSNTTNVIKDAIASNVNVLFVGGRDGCGRCNTLFKQISNATDSLNKDFLSAQEIYLVTWHGGESDSVQTPMKAIIDDAGTAIGASFTYTTAIESTYLPFCALIKMSDKKVYWAKGLTSLDANLIKTYLGDNPKKTYHEVTFEDWDGRILKTQEVEDGQDATPPSQPSRGGYEFTEWSGNYKNVRHDETVTAQYKKVQPDTQQGKLITASYCFGAKRDVTFQCSDGKSVYYLYPENYIVDSLENKITFDSNNATSGKQDDTPVLLRKTWVCPSPTISRTSYTFASWNSKKDGTGTTYVPGTSYSAPTKALTLYAQWTASGKLYAVLAGYSNDSSHNSLNSVSADEIEKLIKNYSSSNITKLNGSEAKPASILSAITDALSKDDCRMLFIYLCGHGSRMTEGKQTCSRIKYKGDYLNGVQLWNALKDAKCKVFVAIHTCHAGSFFKTANLQSESTENAGDAHADFIADARQFFSKLNQQKASNSLFAAATAGEPKLLIWTSNKADEYGWMVNSSTKTYDPAWYKAYGEVGTGLEVSMKKNFDMNKTYARWWTDSTKSGEASRKNPAYISGTSEFNKKTYMDGGPTPVKDVYGGFNENEKIFTV